MMSGRYMQVKVSIGNHLNAVSILDILPTWKIKDLAIIERCTATVHVMNKRYVWQDFSDTVQCGIMNIPVIHAYRASLGVPLPEET